MAKVTSRSRRYREKREQKRKRRIEKHLPRFLLEASRPIYVLHLISLTFLMLLYTLKGYIDFVYGPAADRSMLVNVALALMRAVLALPPLWASFGIWPLFVGGAVVWSLLLAPTQYDVFVTMGVIAVLVYLLWRSRDVYLSGK